MRHIAFIIGLIVCTCWCLCFWDRFWLSICTFVLVLKLWYGLWFGSIGSYWAVLVWVISNIECSDIQFVRLVCLFKPFFFHTLRGLPSGPTSSSSFSSSDSEP